MPAPSPRPWTDDELAALAQTTSAAELARQAGVNKTTVCKWLDKLGIPRRAARPPAAKPAIQCPYSADRLWEMYWREGYTQERIGAEAAVLIGRGTPVFLRTVQRWMREAGVSARSPREWLLKRAREDPERWAEHARRYMAGKGFRPSKGQRLPRRVHNAGVRAAAAKKHAECWETRKCALCGSPTTRRLSEFRHPPHMTFCGPAHASLAGHALRGTLSAAAQGDWRLMLMVRNWMATLPEETDDD